MKTKNIIIAVVAAIIIIGAIIAYFVYSADKDAKATDESTTTQVQAPQPCVDTAALRADLDSKKNAVRTAKGDAEQAIAEMNAAQKALDNAIRKCKPHLTSGDTLVVKVIYEDAKSRSKSSSRISRSETRGGQDVTSKYSEPAKKSVVTSVTGGNTPKALFCVNVHDMDGASYWPHLAIDAGMEIAGAVKNNTGDGYNISIYPVDTPEGLYGATTDGRMFVKAELLDKFNPTVIKMSGSPNGWKVWEEANLEGDYYITPGK
jgi:hypothetical protein